MQLLRMGSSKNSTQAQAAAPVISEAAVVTPGEGIAAPPAAAAGQADPLAALLLQGENDGLFAEVSLFVVEGKTRQGS
jgi:hypothetical protein